VKALSSIPSTEKKIINNAKGNQKKILKSGEISHVQN
jgi:hypothetical protein